MTEKIAKTTADQSNNHSMTGRLGAQLKSAPAGAETPVTPGLIAAKERLMTKRINDESPDHRATCKLFLELSRDDLEGAKRTRDHYIGLARKYGLTNAEIGSALGITEARVRQIVAAQ